MKKTSIELIKAATRMPPFKAELRALIRVGAKTETRRIIDQQPKYPAVRNNAPDKTACVFHRPGDEASDCCHLYPVVAGELRYLREPLIKGPDGLAYYADDKKIVFLQQYPDTGRRMALRWHWKVNTLSQLYMPKEAARTFLRVGQPCAERIQQITPAGAMAEGITPIGNLINGRQYFDAPLPMGMDQSPYESAEMAFRMLWDHINAPRGFGWETNPWVWVIPFKLYV